MSFMSLQSPRWGTLCALAASLWVTASPGAFAQASQWTSFGQNSSNTRHQDNEHRISPATVSRVPSSPSAATMIS